MMHKNSIIALLCLLLIFAAKADTYYASPSGSGNGQSESSPFEISDFWDDAGAGDTLVLLDGNYNNQSLEIQTSGTRNSPIVVMAQNDGEATVDGQDNHIPLLADTKHDVVIQGIVFRNSSEDVVRIRFCERISLHRVSAYDAGPAAGNYHVFVPAYSSEILFEDCAGSGSGRTIYTVYCCKRCTFRRCWGEWMSHGQTPYAFMQIYLSDSCVIENCIGTKDPDTDEEVYGINLWANDESGQYNNTANYNRFYGNVVYNFSGPCYLVNSAYYTIQENRYDHNVAFCDDASLDLWTLFYQTADKDLQINHQTLAGFNSARGYYLSNESDGKQGTWDVNAVLKNSLFIDGYIGIYNEHDRTDGLSNQYNCYHEVYKALQNASDGEGEVEQDPDIDTATFGRGAYLFVPGNSPNKTAGEGGTQIGANVLYRYEDEVLTDEPLWPWPMEDRIFSETGTSVTWEENGGMWKTLDGAYEANGILSLNRSYNRNPLTVVPAQIGGRIRFIIPDRGNAASLKVYDIRGTCVWKAGEVSRDNLWNYRAENTAAGVYFVSLKNNHQKAAKRFVIRR